MMAGISEIGAGVEAGAQTAEHGEAGVGLVGEFKESADNFRVPGAWPRETERQSPVGEDAPGHEEPRVAEQDIGGGEEASIDREPIVAEQAVVPTAQDLVRTDRQPPAGEEDGVHEEPRAADQGVGGGEAASIHEEPRVARQAAVPTAEDLAKIDLGPPNDVHADADISAKLNQHATPEMRARLVHVNTVVQEQNQALQQAVDIGTRPNATAEEKLTATNAKAALGHVYDAVSRMRREIGAADTPAELDAAISEYGKQASMVGGSLGKTIMGLKTLGVRQDALTISRKNLGVAIAGGIGLGAAAIIPSSISASNSSKAASNTANNQQS